MGETIRLRRGSLSVFDKLGQVSKNPRGFRGLGIFGNFWEFLESVKMCRGFQPAGFPGNPGCAGLPEPGRPGLPGQGRPDGVGSNRRVGRLGRLCLGSPGSIPPRSAGGLASPGGGEWPPHGGRFSQGVPEIVLSGGPLWVSSWVVLGCLPWFATSIITPIW